MAKLVTVYKQSTGPDDFGAAAVSLFVNDAWHSSIEGEATAAVIARFTSEALKALGREVSTETIITRDWREFDRISGAGR